MATLDERPPTLLVRVDGGRTIGIGHLMRCLALGHAWKSNGGSVTFLSAFDDSKLRERVEDCGMGFIAVANSHPDPGDLEAVLRFCRDARNSRRYVVLDGYHFDTAYQRSVRSTGTPLLVIDDMAHLPRYSADVVVNQNICADKVRYSSDPGCRYLLGTNFALLRPEFRFRRQDRREIAQRARRVLITMGGVDVNDRTGTVLRALRDVHGIEVRAVIGSGFRHRKGLQQVASSIPGLTLVDNPPDMAALMTWADVAVSGAGSTCWELACIGVPMILLVLAEHQRAVAEGLEAAGIAWNFGSSNEFGGAKIVAALLKLLADYESRQRMSDRGRRTVDGLGAERVVAAFMEAS